MILTTVKKYCTAAVIAGLVVGLQPSLNGQNTNSAFAAGDVLTATGKITETMNAGGYTYIHVENGMGKKWVAIPESVVTVGDSVTYTQGMTMKDFHSKTLGRTFKEVIFSSGLVGGAVVETSSMKEKSKDGKDPFAAAIEKENNQDAGPDLAANPNGSGGAVAPMLNDLKLEKASGSNGYTIEEIFTMSEDLDTKTVRVRGKVVKINMNIMGKNWVHLQDGTGDPMKNSHDLVVTTADSFDEGSEVVIEAIVAAKKDFGAGYKYEVLLEQGKAVAK